MALRINIIKLLSYIHDCDYIKCYNIVLYRSYIVLW